MPTIRSLCIFCGCGCRLLYEVKRGRIERVLPDPDDPVSLGRPCIKGLSIGEIINNLQDMKPMVRDSTRSTFDKVDWKYAIEFIADKIENADPRKSLFIASGDITNENNYIIQKFARLLGCGNIDSCARLCHAPTTTAAMKIYGKPVTPGKFEDIRKCKAVLLAGTDPFTDFPTISQYLRKKKIVWIYPMKTHLSSQKNVFFIKCYPGTVPHVVAAIIKVLYKRGLLKWDPVENDLDELLDISRVSISDVEKAAEILYRNRPVYVMFGMAFTQCVDGTKGAKIILSVSEDLKWVIGPIRGKINVAGAEYTLAKPFLSREEKSALRKAEIPPITGEASTQLLLFEKLDFIMISPSNPAVSFPYLSRVHENLAGAFTVHCTFVPNLTSLLSKVVLPVPPLIGREGTVVTGEGRVRKVEKVLQFNERKEEWEIILELSKKLRLNVGSYSSAKDIFLEILKVCPAFRTVMEDCWKGKEYFVDKECRVVKKCSEKLSNLVHKEDFILTTKRRVSMFSTGDLTRKSQRLLSLYKEGVVYMHPEDMAALGLCKGDLIEIFNSVGSVKARVYPSTNVDRGVILADYHSEKLLINLLTPPILQEESFTPCYKQVPVRVRKIWQ